MPEVVDTWSQTYSEDEVVLEVVSENMAEVDQRALVNALETTQEYLTKAWDRVYADTDHSNILTSWAGLLHPEAPYGQHEQGPDIEDWAEWFADPDSSVWADDARIALWEGANQPQELRWIDQQPNADLKVNTVVSGVYDQNTEFGPGIVRRKSDVEAVAIWVPWVAEVNFTYTYIDGRRLNTAFGVLGTAEYRRTADGGWALWDPRVTRDDSIVGAPVWAFIAVLGTESPLGVPHFIKPETNEVLLCGEVEDPQPLVGRSC